MLPPPASAQRPTQTIGADSKLDLSAPFGSPSVRNSSYDLRANAPRNNMIRPQTVNLEDPHHPGLRIYPTSGPSDAQDLPPFLKSLRGIAHNNGAPRPVPTL